MTSASGSGWSIRCGRWQDVLAGEVGDAVVFDGPYSARTHGGHDSGTRSDDSGVEYGHRTTTRQINYEPWSAEDVDAVMRWASVACHGWVVSITDHRLATLYADTAETLGRCSFAPVPLVEIGSRVRLAGDGPSSWAAYVCTSRPRNGVWLSEWRAWRKAAGLPRSLPGAYVYSGKGDRVVMGGKTLASMRAIIRDYTRPGDLVIDPCAGGATTLLAAVMEGRRALGAEMDPATYELAVRRMRAGHTPPLPGLES